MSGTPRNDRLRALVHFDFIVRIGRALHHDSAEFHHDTLRHQCARQSQGEHSRIGIREPVILDHVLGDDVRRKNGGAASGSAGVGESPLRNQREFAGLRAQSFYRQAARDLEWWTERR